MSQHSNQYPNSSSNQNPNSSSYQNPNSPFNQNPNSSSYLNPNSPFNQNPDNQSYTNLMLFGTPNAPGPNSSPSFRPPPPMPQYGMYPPYYQPPPYEYQNPYFQQPQQPFFRQPEPQPEQQPEQQSSQRAGKQVASSPSKRSHKKKTDGSKKTCRKTQWHPSELAWLATCWCDTSEDPEKGNSQKRGTLWGTVQEKFNNNSRGWERGADALSSKWRTVNNVCKEFNGIYKACEKEWGSGRGDKMVYDMAVVEYFDTYHKHFTMQEAWDAVKDHPKWIAPPSVGGTGLRDEEEDFFDDSVDLSADHTPSQQNELFGPDPIPRPMGRDRAKKAARSSGSSDAATSSRVSAGSDKMDEALDNMARYKADILRARKESIETITRQERFRTAMQGVEFLKLNPSDIQDPTDRQAVVRMKKKFRKEFREFYEAEDEDSDDDE